jgi:hypothetical protein
MDEETLVLLEKISRIKAIHCGGCGIVMLALYRHLCETKKLHGDEQFVYWYTNEFDSDLCKNQAYTNSGEGCPSSCSHATLFHNGRFWDSDGEVHKVLYPVSFKIDVENEKFVIHSLNNMDRWNCCFDRTKNIPIIEEILNVKLNDIER